MSDDVPSTWSGVNKDLKLGVPGNVLDDGTRVDFI